MGLQVFLVPHNIYLNTDIYFYESESPTSPMENLNLVLKLQQILTIFTARKGSLGQGNIFTPVCHSVHGGGHAWLLPGGACVVAFEGVCMVAPGGRGACVVAWGGMHGCSRGMCVILFGGACVLLFGGHAWFYLGGHAWFYSGGHAWFYSGGCAWFYLGGMHGFIWGVCMVLFRGACMVFSVFSDTMRYGQ